jgi:hypothetical protein
MSDALPVTPITKTAPVRATRTAASGACGCARRWCWHQRQCRSSGVVRILRAPEPNKDARSSIVLCRECAAPTQRSRAS